MLLLFETPAGFSLFKVKDEGKLEDVEVRARPGSLRVWLPTPGPTPRPHTFFRLQSYLV